MLPTTIKSVLTGQNARSFSILGGHGACLFVFPHSIMLPRHVADAIRYAIKHGWKPGATGANVWFAFDSNRKGETLLESIPDDDFRVATYGTMGELPENIDLSKYPDTRKWYNRRIEPDSKAASAE